MCQSFTGVDQPVARNHTVPYTCLAFMAEFTARELEAIRHIRNSLVHRGRTPSVRELMAALGYRSPRSAHEVLSQLAAKRIIRRFESGDYQLLSDPELGSAHT